MSAASRVRRSRVLSTADQPATFRILEDGPLRAHVEIREQIASNVVT